MSWPHYAKFATIARYTPKSHDRRELLANWLTSADNPYFARNLANIVWAHFMGRGIVEPVDDVRVSNPPSNPELLDQLGRTLRESNFDFKKLVREICTSRTYQLDSSPTAGNEFDDRNFSHAAIRRMRAEVLLDCIGQVTQTREKFRGLPLGSRAVQIVDGQTTNYFLTTFGRAARETVCSCEVVMQPNLSQALHLINGDTAAGKIVQGGVVRKMLAEKKTPRQIIQELYVCALCRPPTEQEQRQLESLVGADKPGAAAEDALNDVFWALLNSKEFMFNH